MIVYDQDFSGIFNSIWSDLKNYVSATITLGLKVTDYEYEFEKIIESFPAQEPDVAVSEDDIACIIFTSGTTGEPKGIVRSHRAIIDNATIFAHFLHRGAPNLRPGCPCCPSDRNGC